MRFPLPRNLSLIAGAALLSVFPAAAQTNLETNAGIEFNFSTPGASNLARGGAFLALADDATTAYTNPAGLTNLFDPEVSLEVRSWRFTHVFTDRGRREGQEPTDRGVDTLAGLRDGEASNEVTGISFLSYVYPREKIAVAIYRHELVSFEADFETQGAFLEETNQTRGPLGLPGVDDGRLASLRNRMRLDVESFGLSAAYRFGPGLSLGLGLAYFDFSLDSRADRFVPPFFEAPDFRPEKVVSFQTQRGDDSDWGIRAGFLWTSDNRLISVGGAFRQGADFAVLAESRNGPASPAGFAEKETPSRFNIPDVYGLGIALRLTASFQITFDYDRVEYSDLKDGLVDIFGLDGLIPGLDPETGSFRIDDADELRLGFESSLLKLRFPISLRYGVWYDPDHTLRFEGENSSLRTVFRPRDDEFHLSFGVGLPRERFQLHAGVDVSDRVTTAALSTVLRF